MTDRERLLSVKEAAARAQRSPSTIYRWADEGVLTKVMRGKNEVLIRAEELRRLSEPRQEA